MTLKRTVIFLAAVVLLSFGHSQMAAAQTSSATSPGSTGSTSSLQASSPQATVEELQKQLQTLLNQMASLQKEIAILKSGSTQTAPATTPAPASSSATAVSGSSPEPEMIDESEMETGTEVEFITPPTLTRSLSRGARGEDVRQLQEFLAQYSDIYPEGIVTGYYGIGTEAAIKRWQTKNGLPSVGIVGRQTISKFSQVRAGTAVPSVSGGQARSAPAPETTVTAPVRTQPTTPVESVRTEICPALPTVDSCPAGEEKVVTYQSDKCGTYYTCKARENTGVSSSNTVATLKKMSSIQTDNRYALILNDPDGIQKFAVVNSKGTSVQTGYPSCRKDWTTPTIIIESAVFPPKVILYDCGNPSSHFTAILDTPVVVQTVSGGISFPYTFTNGKVVNSFGEASAYCYANGPGIGQGVAADCETKFGIVYQQVTTNSSGGSSGRAIYSSASFESCMTRYGFKAEAGLIKSWAQSSSAIPWSQLSAGAQNSVTVCEREYYGQNTTESGTAMCSDRRDNDGDGFIDSADPSCYGYTSTTTTTATSTTQTSTTAPPAGQKEQIWNSLGLRSWIRTDADSSRVTQLKQSCVNTPSGSNIWMPNAGVSTSVDFGMPDAAKCQRAAGCSSGQYFDGASCVASTTTTTTTSTTSNSANWVRHSWSFKDGYTESSYVLNRADQEYSDFLARTHAQCLTINRSQFAWKSNAGSDAASNWQNFGIPDCTGTASSQTSGVISGGSTYAGDANSCPGFAYSRWDSSSPSRRYCQLNTETRCDYNYPSYLTNGSNYTAANCPAGSSGSTYNYSGTTSGSCRDVAPSWPVQYGSYCLNDSRTQYVPLSSPMASSAQSCTGADSPVSGCTPPGGGSSGSSGAYCGSGYYWNGSSCMLSSSSSGSSCSSGQYWNGTACVTSTYSSDPATACAQAGGSWNTSSSYCQMPTSSTSGSTSCSSGQYWNGTACVTSATSSSNCSTPSNCYDSSVCASSGWSWYNSGCWSSPQTSSSGSTGSTNYSSDPATACAQAGGTWSSSSNYCQMPGSTSSGSTSSSTSCASGQYWNGSSCVSSGAGSSGGSSGSTTTCSSGQYWNGTACVTSTAPSASIYEQMSKQLKSLEVILRGLMGQ